MKIYIIWPEWGNLNMKNISDNGWWWWVCNEWWMIISFLDNLPTISQLQYPYFDFFVGGGGLEVRVNCDWSGWTILWCESYCGLWGEWTILWGLVTVGLVRRWNAINYQTMPPTTLHRLTNWNQRNNSTIEAIRKDDDDRSFTGNETGQYWGKGGFDSLKRTQMVLLNLLYSISISGWTFSSIFVLSLVTTGNFITEQRKPRTKTSLLRGSLAPTFFLNKPAGQSHF